MTTLDEMQVWNLDQLICATQFFSVFLSECGGMAGRLLEGNVANIVGSWFCYFTGYLAMSKLTFSVPISSTTNCE
jgi:hypothetical protein